MHKINDGYCENVDAYSLCIKYIIMKTIKKKYLKLLNRSTYLILINI